ncbi:hypothetical protein EGH24_04180 [Halonotius terrestris]|uniref:Uncharacterized protein n=1 Tax=Halonotius terrestris TaxID=2487750 RepID=A0A8J8P866_9EURY|nr:hypothetical protein [Halonotius terrestris]TQQ82655.1 hypothetical protein EGH24_04180 [Halonotius terrestris]
MNKHFSDTRYYLSQAASHLKRGLSEELSPVVRRVRSRLGREVPEPEPETRAEKARVVAETTAARVVETATGAKRRVDQRRGDDDAAA